jgi:hypothetical protein
VLASHDLEEWERMPGGGQLDDVEAMLVLVGKVAFDLGDAAASLGVGLEVKTQDRPEQRRAPARDLVEVDHLPVAREVGAGLGQVQAHDVAGWCGCGGPGSSTMVVGLGCAGIDQREEERELVGGGAPAFVDHVEQALGEHLGRIAGRLDRWPG